MTYVTLGPRTKTGAADPNNPLGAGNWTVTFTPADLVTNVPQYECYRIALTGPSGSTFQWFINNIFYDNVLHGDINSWNPPQPAILRPGERLDFYWSTNATPAPVVTLYLRFDPAAQPYAGQHYT